MDDFYAARSSTSPPLPWSNFAPPFSRIDPAKRADRFTETWQRMHQQRTALSKNGEHDAARKIGGQMGAMAKSLERDAQVESILSARKASLGIDMRSVRPVAQELADIAALGRGRSLGIGIGM